MTANFNLEPEIVSFVPFLKLNARKDKKQKQLYYSQTRSLTRKYGRRVLFESECAGGYYYYY